MTRPLVIAAVIFLISSFTASAGQSGQWLDDQSCRVTVAQRAAGLSDDQLAVPGIKFFCWTLDDGRVEGEKNLSAGIIARLEFNPDVEDPDAHFCGFRLGREPAIQTAPRTADYSIIPDNDVLKIDAHASKGGKVSLLIYARFFKIVDASKIDKEKPFHCVGEGWFLGATVSDRATPPRSSSGPPRCIGPFLKDDYGIVGGCYSTSFP
jgi:hypothetical protein